jgi:hypothetical protein
MTGSPLVAVRPSMIEEKRFEQWPANPDGAISEAP